MTEVLKFLGGTAIALGAIAWLIRSLASHFLGKDIERFKAELQASGATQLEILRHDLRSQSAAEEKQVTILLEKRAAVIAELYTLLIDFIGSAESFLSYFEYEGEPTKPEKAVVLSGKAANFRTYYVRHRIYFTDGLCEKVEALFDAVHTPAIRYRIWLRAVEDGDNVKREYQDAWTQAWDSIQREVPPLEKAVRDEFRALLGVATSKNRQEA